MWWDQGNRQAQFSYLLFVFHLVRHIFLHSVFIKFIQSCFQNIIFSNTINQIYTTVALKHWEGWAENILSGIIFLLENCLDQPTVTAVTGDNTLTARAQYDEKLPTFWAIFGLLCIFFGGGGKCFKENVYDKISSPGHQRHLGSSGGAPTASGGPSNHQAHT